MNPVKRAKMALFLAARRPAGFRNPSSQWKEEGLKPSPLHIPPTPKKGGGSTPPAGGGRRIVVG